MSAYQLLLDEIKKVAKNSGRDPSSITLIAVSKKSSWEEVLPLYKQGALHFGENRIEEALEKKSLAPEGVHWHFIGHLQRKKVSKAIGQFSLIHSVDTVSLAEKISSCSQEKGVVTPILLQANTSQEKTKQGLSEEECLVVIDHLIQLPGIEIQGLMTMAPFTKEEEVIRQCFRRLRELRDCLEDKTKQSLPHLSMGMSNDYRIAIEEGATLLRVGSALFKLK